jgi:hypothetical protein
MQEDSSKMFDTLKRDASLCALLTAAILVVAAPSFAQPTEAQKEAVKSACRSDFMAHCSSVTPGGEAALQCLAKNMSSLSAGCASAVKAVEASAAPKSEPAKAEAAPAAAPAAAAPKTETKTEPRTESKTESKTETKTEPKSEAKAAPGAAAKKPTDAQAAAIRSACRGDYPKVCAGVPTGGRRTRPEFRPVAARRLPPSAAELPHLLQAQRPRPAARRRPPLPP